jgi:5-methyltetrahydropteroyltriglutamate--homocysteine methyltransferase
MNPSRYRETEKSGECVRQQRNAGLDIVNDGEWSKPDYSTYVKNRFTGFEGEPTPADIGRDMVDFPEYAAFRRTGVQQMMRPKCNGPIAWVKLGTLAEGARLASQKLWARP